MNGDIAYLDNAASTPLDPSVKEAMVQAMALQGNPSAIHGAGRDARKIIDTARASVADLLDTDASTIVFTSGATESNTTAILGYLGAVAASRVGEHMHVLTTPLEHPSVKAALAMATDRFSVTVEELPVDVHGRVEADAVAQLLRPETVLISMMWVSNLFGTVQPVVETGEAVCAERKARNGRGMPIAFFTDAVQALGTLAVSPDAVHADLLSVSAHKIYGPKGTGALYLREGTPFLPLVAGGRQERSRRGGTEDLVGIAGFGAASRVLAERREQDVTHGEALIRRLEEGLNTVPTFVRIIGDGVVRVPTARYGLFSLEGDLIVVTLDVAGVAVSSGSACDTGSRKTSDALALVCGQKEAIRGGVRFSVGRFTTEEDIDRAIAAVRAIGTTR